MVYNEYLVNDIRDILLSNNETIATAESVTAGNIQVALSIGADASQYFQGGITVFNLGQKTRHLCVEPIEALRCNCISANVSIQMAVNVAEKFTSTYGIAITGYASTVPENEDEGLHAFVAAAYRNTIVISERITSQKEGLYDVQVDYTNQVLKLLLSWLNTNRKKPL